MFCFVIFCKFMLMSRLLTLFFVYFDTGFCWNFPFSMAKAPPTFIDFKLLWFSSIDGDVLRDVHWFIGLSIVSSMYKKSFSVHQALEGQWFPT